MVDPRTRTRDLLANERMYLAWLRTAAAVMVLGLAIAKFGDEGKRALAAGAVLVAVGAAGVFEGVRRQRRVALAIEVVQAMPTGGEVVLVVAIVTAPILLLA